MLHLCPAVVKLRVSEGLGVRHEVVNPPVVLRRATASAIWDGLQSSQVFDPLRALDLSLLFLFCWAVHWYHQVDLNHSTPMTTQCSCSIWQSVFHGNHYAGTPFAFCWGTSDFCKKLAVLCFVCDGASANICMISRIAALNNPNLLVRKPSLAVTFLQRVRVSRKPFHYPSGQNEDLILSLWHWQTDS